MLCYFKQNIYAYFPLIMKFAAFVFFFKYSTQCFASNKMCLSTINQSDIKKNTRYVKYFVVSVG